jgi:prephenate dehydrogenase
MRIAIIGLGLIGGSLGLSLKRSYGKTVELVGYARRDEVAWQAVRRGAVDRTETSLASTVKDCRLVFICTPVLAVEEVLRQIARHLPENCVVTDTASTKERVMEWATEHLCPRSGFVGGHPMAGKETSGIEAAEANLFQGCTYCLTPAPWTGRSDRDLVSRTVRRLGARPFPTEARTHDFLVAAISHLPMLLSAATVSITTAHRDWPTMARLASTGYRDVTRLAAADPRVTGDIFTTNREALLHWIDEFHRELGRLREMVARGDSDLEGMLTRTSKARQRWSRERQRGL